MSTLKEALPRSESELGRNRAEHGERSYYYAHKEGWEVPKDAVVRSGPGLVTGGVPTPLGPDGEPVPVPPPSAQDEDGTRDEVVSQLRARVAALESELMKHRAGARTITQFSFSDEGAKCKVYCELGSGVLERKEELDGEVGVGHAEGAVAVTFSDKTCCLRVLALKPSGAVAERLAVTFVCQSEVIPGKCAYRVDRAKGRVTLTLRKKDELKAWANITTATTM